MHFPNKKNTSLKEKLNMFFLKYKYALLLLYFLIYLPWFGYLENTVTKHFHVIHMAIDDKIPFIEYFIVPYLLWFVYIAVGIIYFLFKDKAEYCRLCAFLFTGMTVFLIVSTIYPNGHHLRPTEFARDNIFVDMVRVIYGADTSTNLFPSIHVYNSIGVNIAVWHSERFRKKKLIRYGSAILMVSIVLSTMFLKQHSVFDVITGIVLSIFVYTIVYSKNRYRVGEPRPSLENWFNQI